MSFDCDLSTKELGPGPGAGSCGALSLDGGATAARRGEERVGIALEAASLTLEPFTLGLIGS